MANQEQLAILKQGVEAWNTWRNEHPKIRPNLRRADLREANLRGGNLSYADLREANLSYANLVEAILYEANLCEANLSYANLMEVILYEANLSKAILGYANLMVADLREADLRGSNLIRANLIYASLEGANLREANLGETHLNRADLSFADLSFADLSYADLGEANLVRANLIGANLSRTLLIETNFTEATLVNCNIYGISAWNVQLTNAKQENLIITQEHEATITVDNLKVAQFIYLILNNQEIRDVIDTLTTKSVLILGRFTPERKAILDALRDALRRYNYLPILFDFEKPSSRDLTETVSALAHLSRFIIADLTEPSSIPKELEAIVPTLTVPVQPLLEGSTRPYAMFRDYWKYHWVLEVYRYNGLEELVASLEEYIIEPAERKAEELAELRACEFKKQ